MEHDPCSGRFCGREHILPLRIYYEDTDFSGLVYHASYLRFLERGRTELLRAAGIDQQALHGQTGCAFVVRQMSLDYLKPARMDDGLLVETAVAELRGPLLRLDQAVRREADTLVQAAVTVVCIRNGRPVRLPDAVREALKTQ